MSRVIRRHKFELPFPPSVNHYWRHTVVCGHPSVYISGEGKRYQQKVKAVLISTPLYNAKISARVAVTVLLSPPDRRKRDLDNYMKSLFDALTYCQLWIDDEQVDAFHVMRQPVVKGGLIQLEIEELPEIQPELFTGDS